MLAHAESYGDSPVDLNTFKTQVATMSSWQTQVRARVLLRLGAPISSPLPARAIVECLRVP